MGRVLTNAIGMAFAQEPDELTQKPVGVNDDNELVDSRGTRRVDAGWQVLEANEISQFGVEVQTVARQPISADRQPREGAITSVSSGVGFAGDVTMSFFRAFLEGFLFAKVVNREFTEVPVTGTTATMYQFAAISGERSGMDGDDQFDEGSLLWASGFGDSRDGFKVSRSSTTMSVTAGTSMPTTTPPAGANISFAGYRAATASWTYDTNNRRGTLSRGSGQGLGTKLMELGLTPGQFVHIGSLLQASGQEDRLENGITVPDSPAPRFTGYGYARVWEISADAVVFDKLGEGLKGPGHATAAGNQDICFGEFGRNLRVSDGAFLPNRTFSMEQLVDGLAIDRRDPHAEDAGPFQYSLQNYCNELGITLNLDALATMTMGFVGTETLKPQWRRATGTGNDGSTKAEREARNGTPPAAPNFTSGFSSSSDVARLRIIEIDEDGIGTDFKSLTLNIGNNVSQERVVGRQAARFVNYGNFDVNLEAELIFTDGAIVDAIRQNTRLSFDCVMSNDDGVIIVDLPAVSLGGGGRSYPVNESVLISVSAQAFRHQELGTSVGFSTIPVPIPDKDLSGGQQ